MDRLESWAALDQARRRFSHCDDGSIAEGFSEAVARLLVDRWKTLRMLTLLARQDARLTSFVLKHIDA
ncbi:MAG TPA: hypothetical protein VFF16_11535, partial [Telluria sp.]|nr:hypothetical protein [Telluria sp.]